MQKKIKLDSHRRIKALTAILRKHSGRDVSGQLSVRHQGGRQKRYYRIIDFRRDKKNILGIVRSIEYDPGRNAHIALIEYADKEKRYILHPKGLKVKDQIVAGDNVDIKVGNCLPLKNIPVGIQVHNIELYVGNGGQMMRSAGSFAVVIAKEAGYVHLKLPSGEIRKFKEDCTATVGVVGNIEAKDEVIGKAGRTRHMGIRPTVRGTAQDPRSHPHGGGEGRVGEGMHPKTPWGKAARGKRTRKLLKYSSKLIIKRRK